jgi:hypothetical protein
MSNLDPFRAATGVGVGEALSLAWQNIASRPLIAGTSAATLALTGCGLVSAETVEWPRLARPAALTEQEGNTNNEQRGALRGMSCASVTARSMGTATALIVQLEGGHPTPAGVAVEYVLNTDGDTDPKGRFDGLSATLYHGEMANNTLAEATVHIPYTLVRSRGRSEVKVEELNCPAAPVVNRDTPFTLNDTMVRLDDSPPPPPAQ